MSGGLSIEMWRAEDGDVARSAALQADVFAELAWEPVLSRRQVRVFVQDRIATLSGCVHSLLEKIAAERAAGRVRGIVRIQNDVRVVPTPPTSDAAIATAARGALAADALLGPYELGVKVRDGWIEITGQVGAAYARQAAEGIVSRLRGVMGITNLLTIESGPPVVDLAARADEALERCGAPAARHLKLDVNGIAIVARGSTRSLADRDRVLETLRDVPGVAAVVDQTYVAD